MNPRVAKLVRELPDKVRAGVSSISGWRHKQQVGALVGPAHPVFEVMHGAHSGATLDLHDASYTIGSSTEADIFLSDEGIADIHTRLHVKGNRVELEATGGPVGLADGETIPTGHGRRCRLPVDISLGQARFRVVGASSERTRIAFSNHSLFALSGIFVAIFAGFIASNSLSRAEPDAGWPAKNAGMFAMLGLNKTDIAEPPASDQATQTSIELARDQLADRLEQAGIASVAVTVDQDRLIASGTLAQAQVGAWRTVRAWFDQNHGGRVLLVSDVATGDAAQMPRIRLQAIWYGAQPYIIAADGTRYHEGAFVSGGWTITEIGETQLVLTKAGDTVALKYQ